MGFIDGLLNRKRPAAAETQAPAPELAIVTHEIGPAIATAHDFQAKATPAIRAAHQYFTAQIDSIPGPLALESAAYGSNRLLRALFPTDEEIRFAIGRSVQARDAVPALANAGAEKIVALLGMRPRDRDESIGPGTVLADHTLSFIGEHAEATRAALRDAAFLRLLKIYSAHIEKLRHYGKLLAGEWNIEFAIDDNDPAAKLRKEVFSDYVHADKELTPDNLLRGLIAWLERPDDHFRVIECGFVAPSIPGVGRETFGLPVPLLETTDRRKWLTVLVEIPIAEAMAAVQAETRVHRYIMV